MTKSQKQPMGVVLSSQQLHEVEKVADSMFLIKNGKRGTLVASIKGTLSKNFIKVLLKLSMDKRLQVMEATLDMAKNMEAAVKTVFTDAQLVTDRFHVIKLAMEALQHTRINQRWKELDKEKEAIK